jgi:hypothetical protein
MSLLAGVKSDLKTPPIIVAGEVTKLKRPGSAGCHAKAVKASLRRLLLFKKALRSALCHGIVVTDNLA